MQCTTHGNTLGVRNLCPLCLENDCRNKDQRIKELEGALEKILSESNLTAEGLRIKSHARKALKQGGE